MNNNLWILTEEIPKPDTISQIISIYYQHNNMTHTINKSIQIIPIFDKNIFTFTYRVDGVKIPNIKKIYIEIVGGKSSFVDYLLFVQEKKPLSGQIEGLLMAIEETKTTDAESRNTGVYQRGTKFVYIEKYKTLSKLYMIYGYNQDFNKAKKVSDTNVFGTRLLTTLGVIVKGKDNMEKFPPFKDIEELITSKNKMRLPSNGIPILINKLDDNITVSGRLNKPETDKKTGEKKERLANDPNIGALSLICKCLRKLGWGKNITIIKHDISQDYVTKNPNNKFLQICDLLNISLDGVDLSPPNEEYEYWEYADKSEKITSIFLHIVSELHGIKPIYHNHAGCERSYFVAPNNPFIQIKKTDATGKKIPIPDLILHDDKKDVIYIIEGKQLSKIKKGLEVVDSYDIIEKEYISKYYPECKILRYLSIFGGKKTELPHDRVLIYINNNGNVFINPTAPKHIQNILKKIIKQ